MLRLSRLTDYAVVALVHLGQAKTVATTPGIAAAIGLPEPTIAKVLKALAGHDIVTSLRGARGGYLLARPLAEISVADVILAIDGPIALTSCVDGGINCTTHSLCPMAGRWDPVNDAIRDALSGIPLSQMARNIPPAFRLPVAGRDARIEVAR